MQKYYDVMIIEFSVKNYRSIRDLQTISFKATGLKSPAGSDIDADNIVKSNGVSLLKTVGLYGANASGKSNILMALSYFTSSRLIGDRFTWSTTTLRPVSLRNVQRRLLLSDCIVIEWQEVSLWFCGE